MDTLSEVDTDRGGHTVSGCTVRQAAGGGGLAGAGLSQSRWSIGSWRCMEVHGGACCKPMNSLLGLDSYLSSAVLHDSI